MVISRRYRPEGEGARAATDPDAGDDPVGARVDARDDSGPGRRERAVPIDDPGADARDPDRAGRRDDRLVKTLLDELGDGVRICRPRREPGDQRPAGRDRGGIELRLGDPAVDLRR